MISQTKCESAATLNTNPNFEIDPKLRRNESKANQQKKSKSFKIKKNKILLGKKQMREQKLLNPLYLDLQNEENNQESKVKFGPWTNDNLPRKVTPLPQRKNKRWFDDKDSINPINPMNDGLNQHDFYRQTLNHGDQQRKSLVHIFSAHSTQMKPKRQLHELRYSSLEFQIPKPKLQIPLKVPQMKKSPRTRNKSQCLPLDILLYESLKYLPETEKYFGKKPNRKPNNVIYNYCYSTSECNMFTGTNEPIETIKRNLSTKQLLESNKSLKEDSMKPFKNPIKQPRFSLKSLLVPLKKSINQQLYDDLIKKKNKVK